MAERVCPEGGEGALPGRSRCGERLPGRDSRGAEALGWALRGRSWPRPALAAGWETKHQDRKGQTPGRQLAEVGLGGVEEAHRGRDLCTPARPFQAARGAAPPSPCQASRAVAAAAPVPLFNDKPCFSPSADRATGVCGSATIWPRFLAWNTGPSGSL